jgi:hypothetical protein
MTIDALEGFGASDRLSEKDSKRQVCTREGSEEVDDLSDDLQREIVEW